MIPASHLLSGYLAGRLAGWRWPGTPTTRNPLRDPLVLTAVLGSLLPDWDVLPGLVAGYGASGFHRGATHSPVGVLLQTLLLATLAHRFFRTYRARHPASFFAGAPPWQPLAWASFLGLTTHVLLDYLNPWGVALYWPFERDGRSAQLVHEGDLYVFAILLASAALVFWGLRKTGCLLAVVLIPAFLLFQFARRGQIEQWAARQLATERHAVYPTSVISCPWLLLSRSKELLTARCAPGLAGAPDKIVKSVPLVGGSAIQATEGLAEVQDFRETRDFPFAEVRTQPTGETLVLWRDLRDAALEGATPRPYGLHVALNPDGEVESLTYRWRLPFWF